MGRFEKLVEKFRHAQEQIKSLGKEIIDTYPNTPRLAEMSTEIDTAVDALDTLAGILEKALEAADQDEGLFKELKEQMDESEIYSQLTPAERKKLSEYLVQNKKGLADEATLTGYVKKSLAQKDNQALVAMYPKATILERGKEKDTGTDDFDAYQAGLESFRKDFEMDREAAIDKLAAVWLQRGLPAIAREFYAEAFKPEEEETD